MESKSWGDKNQCSEMTSPISGLSAVRLYQQRHVYSIFNAYYTRQLVKSLI